ncbi:MAG TPA: hypothetical protein VMG99_07895 [Thermoplasmata archaeon]|nr:hypothetical protein [Thermoplasmata archaeon]
MSGPEEAQLAATMHPSWRLNLRELEEYARLEEVTLGSLARPPLAADRGPVDPGRFARLRAFVARRPRPPASPVSGRGSRTLVTGCADALAGTAGALRLPIAVPADRAPRRKS